LFACLQGVPLSDDFNIYCPYLSPILLLFLGLLGGFTIGFLMIMADIVSSQVSVTSGTDLNTIVFNVGYNMIQIAIGITVGLFLSALIVYPLGKRRSGLFSF